MGGEMLKGRRVAIIAAAMVERGELVRPRKALEEAGATTELVSLDAGEVQSVDHFDKAATHRVDRSIDAAEASEFDALEEFAEGGHAGRREKSRASG